MDIVLAIVNIILCLFVAHSYFSIVKHEKFLLTKEHRRVKKLIGLMAIFWAIIYCYVIIADLGYIPQVDQVIFGSVIIRPANTLFFGLLAASGLENLLRYKRYLQFDSDEKGKMDEDI